MSVINSFRRSLAPIHPEGYVFVAGFAVAALILWWIWSPLGCLGLIATLWCVYFFRDPARVTPVRPDLVIAPADGVVSFAGLGAPPPELGLGMGPLQRVSIFMSVFDCHVNRAPVEGRVERIAYHPGLFLSADLDKASDDNERNSIVIDAPSGRYGVVQIAGLIARRIVCFTHEGARVRRGRTDRPHSLRLAGRRLSSRKRADCGRPGVAGGRRGDGHRRDRAGFGRAPVPAELTPWTRQTPRPRRLCRFPRRPSDAASGRCRCGCSSPILSPCSRSASG